MGDSPDHKGIPGNRLVPLLFLAFFLFTVVMAVGTFYLGHLFAPKAGTTPVSHPAGKTGATYDIRR